jgi:hypothetical protein
MSAGHRAWNVSPADLNLTAAPFNLILTFLLAVLSHRIAQQHGETQTDRTHENIGISGTIRGK